MTIKSEEMTAVAPHVSAKAEARRDFKNPFITLQSLEILCQGDETLMECLHDMVMYSLRYAETVCQFEQIASRGHESLVDGTRAEIDRVRTSIHDATMTTINVLSRCLKRANKDNQWISKLSIGGRPAYGKFALLIAFEVILQGKNEQH